MKKQQRNQRKKRGIMKAVAKWRHGGETSAKKIEEKISWRQHGISVPWQHGEKHQRWRQLAAKSSTA